MAMLNNNPVPQRIRLGELLCALIDENAELRSGAIAEPIIRVSAGDCCLGHPGPRRQRSLCTKYITYTHPAGFSLPKVNWEPRIVPVAEMKFTTWPTASTNNYCGLFALAQLISGVKRIRDT